ncbi:hypothetical protein H2204_005978 [Knufia peltigerae]|uniref:Heme haloperoxidase family profile domain-containing protein n=1 Tax=Knufia peltigerae TaxID=1002370 RepID=A0AA38Y4M0_9EURO|nr:hypothetical protein H2204_005978 [Knufia peltigerae]
MSTTEEIKSESGTTTLQGSLPLDTGTYQTPPPSALRSACPMINALANHGYLPRDGRQVTAADLESAMSLVGLSPFLGGLFSNAVFLEHPTPDSPKPSLFSRLRAILRNPWEILPHRLGVMLPGQAETTSAENPPIRAPTLTLADLSLHGAIEHDVSLSRRDEAQGDNHTPQHDLIYEIMAASNGDKTLTMDDLCALRKRRIRTQRTDNQELQYGSFEHELGCGEIALMLKIFGDGESVKRDYLQAFFAEERLPLAEGWDMTRRRSWWKRLGLVELKWTVEQVKKRIGKV